jgi:hypothetical protein
VIQLDYSWRPAGERRLDEAGLFAFRRVDQGPGVYEFRSRAGDDGAINCYTREADLLDRPGGVPAISIRTPGAPVCRVELAPNSAERSVGPTGYSQDRADQGGPLNSTVGNTCSVARMTQRHEQPAQCNGGPTS